VRFQNFVRGSLEQELPQGSGVITVRTPAFVDPPAGGDTQNPPTSFQPPPDPKGERAYMVLMDDLRRPSEIEVISYTSADTKPDVDGSQITDLTGVQRGLSGTDDVAWDAGTPIGMDIPAHMIGVLGEEGEEGDVLTAGADGYLTYRAIEWRDLVGKALARGGVLLEDAGEPPTPDAGEVHVYLEGHHLWAKFDDGTVKPVPDPPPPEPDTSDVETAVATSSTSLSIPGSVEEGDLIMIVLGAIGGSTGDSLRTPSGYSIAIANEHPDWDHPHVAVLWRISDGTETSVNLSADYGVSVIAGIACRIPPARWKNGIFGGTDTNEVGSGIPGGVGLSVALGYNAILFAGYCNDSSAGTFTIDEGNEVATIQEQGITLSATYNQGDITIAQSDSPAAAVAGIEIKALSL